MMRERVRPSTSLLTALSVPFAVAALAWAPSFGQDGVECGTSETSSEDAGALCATGRGATESAANADANFDLDQKCWEEMGGCDDSVCVEWETCMPGAIVFSSGSKVEGRIWWDSQTQQYVQEICFTGGEEGGSYTATCSACAP